MSEHTEHWRVPEDSYLSRIGSALNLSDEELAICVIELHNSHEGYGLIQGGQIKMKVATLCRESSLKFEEAMEIVSDFIFQAAAVKWAESKIANNPDHDLFIQMKKRFDSDQNEKDSFMAAYIRCSSGNGDEFDRRLLKSELI